MNELSTIRDTSNGLQFIPVDSELFTDRIVFITDHINDESALNFEKEMLSLMKSPEPIRIIINCLGGEVMNGLMMYDLINGCRNELEIYCTGIAASMAAILLASGQKGRRYILPHSKVMIHEPLIAGGVGGSATSISKISESVLETRELVNGILAEHTGKTIEEINAATAYDNYMNAEEAVKFGICDEIRSAII